RVSVHEVETAVAVGVDDPTSLATHGVRGMRRMEERRARIAAGHHSLGALEQALGCGAWLQVALDCCHPVLQAMCEWFIRGSRHVRPPNGLTLRMARRQIDDRDLLPDLAREIRR